MGVVMGMRRPAIVRTPQLEALVREAARQGRDIMERLLRQSREALQRQVEQTRDLRERDACDLAMAALTQAGPDLRERFPQLLLQAFERDLSDDPASSVIDAGLSSIKFEQLELMDEKAVQQRILAVRGEQQALQEAEQELAELNTLVSALLGFDQVRAERNPLRPEVYVQALQELLGDMKGATATQTRCRQVMVPLLGPSLRQVYQELQKLLRAQKVQPVRYVIQRDGGATAVASRGDTAAPGVAAPRQGASAAPATDAGLTVQRLHGLVAGGVTQQDDRLVHEVVHLIIANLASDERMLAPVREIISGLEPALLALARHDANFFHDKQHPARLLLEEASQHAFAYDSVEATGFASYAEQLRQACRGLERVRDGDVGAFTAALEQLRRYWAQEDRRLQGQQQQAVQALQLAEQRNRLAAQIAEHIRVQPETVMVPEVVVQFACGPWSQVMAQARLQSSSGGDDPSGYVSLLERLFWSVRPDQAGRQPARLVKLIPILIKGLQQGLTGIHYPPDRQQAFLSQLYELHQGVLNGERRKAERVVPPAPAPVQGGPWLAPEEARATGFMDDLEPAAGGEAVDFPPTVPAGLQPAGAPVPFPATEPMSLQVAGAVAVAKEPVATGVLRLQQLEVGSWVELRVDWHWMRLRLAWVNEAGSMCLFCGADGSNHSMTQRTFDRLVAQDELRQVAQGPVVERAFDAVAELAMRNSVIMELR